MKLMQDQPILNDLTDATIQKPGLAEKAAGIMNDPTATLSGWKQWLVDKSPLLVEWAFEIVGVFLLLFIAWLVARWLSRMTTRALTKAKIDLTLVRFFAKLVKWSIMLFAIMACLGQFGFEMTSFAAVIAAVMNS